MQRFCGTGTAMHKREQSFTNTTAISLSLCLMSRSPANDYCITNEIVIANEWTLKQRVVVCPLQFLDTHPLSSWTCDFGNRWKPSWVMEKKRRQTITQSTAPRSCLQISSHSHFSLNFQLQLTAKTTVIINTCKIGPADVTRIADKLN